MAFEAYRRQGRQRSTLRRVLFVVVAALHGAVIAAGVVYSYWHVDELTPPTLRVTFMSGAPVPPPPPPPPPAGGGGKPKRIALKTKTIPTPTEQPKPTEIVQPRERPAPVKKEFRKHDDEEEDEDDDAPKSVKGGVKGGILGGEVGGVLGGTVGGTLGGTKGGVIGGSIGGMGTAPAPSSKFLPPNLGDLQKESGEKPDFPASLRANVGVEYIVLAKICVSTTGAVQTVTLMKKSDPLLNDSVERTVKTWRYRPLFANNTPVPFCTLASFDFKSHR